ncbi:MAG: LysR family transcriptional regulator [Pseudomonadota bacterium]
MDRRLTQFLAVAETGNLSRAAEDLRVSQPTISVNLRRLEEDHGVRLFERSSRGVVLTEFGKILYDHVRAMKRLDDHARTEIRARRSNKEHGLRVGCGYAWWHFPLRDVIAEFRRDNPERSVLIDVSNSLNGLSKVLSGDITLFLGTKVDTLKSELAVDFRPMFDARHAYFARDSHPLAGRPCPRREIDRYERMDVVPLETGHLSIVDPMRSATASGPTAVPPRILSSNSMTVCIDLLTSSDAILGYPRALEDHFARFRIVPLDVQDEETWETIGLYSLEDRGPTRGLSEFVARISGHLEQSRAAAYHIAPSLRRGD